MPILADFPSGSDAVAAVSVASAVPARPAAVSPQRPSPRGRQRPELLFSTILTTSVAFHLLLVGWLGFGVPPAPARLRPVPVAPPPPPVIEDIQLEAPPPPKATPVLRRDPASPALPDLPAPVAAIAAVPASVPVNFAIQALGPVRLVATAGEASGAGLAATAPVPQEVVGRSLLTPALSYPAAALLRRLTGRVVVEFRTSARGDITDARVRVSSGSELLDEAALENLRLGRWVGEAGYFTKTYDFQLR
jgi:TonB family protein